MDDLPQNLASGGIGAVLLLLGLKYVWPLMKNGMDVQLANGRAESQLLRQIMEERDKALARADAADERARVMFQELAELKSQFAIMSKDLEHAKSEVERLRDKGRIHDM